MQHSHAAGTMTVPGHHGNATQSYRPSSSTLIRYHLRSRPRFRAMDFFFVPPMLRPCSSPSPFSSATSPRHPSRTPYAMSASNPPKGPRPSNPDPDRHPSGNDIPYARFREFTASPGDSTLQNDLVREVMWQATRTVTTQNMESTIQEQIDAVSDLLSDMYTRSERDIVERNEELARQTCLPNISKWNQQLIEGHKESKLRRSEISKELEIVDAMLRRSRRKRRSNGLRNSRRRANQTAPQTPAAEAGLDPVPSRLALLRDVLQIKGPKALLFTIAVCVLALESFENIARHENGPSQLANYAAITSVFLLSCAYLHTLRSAYQNANRNLRHTGTFVEKDRNE